MPQWIVTLDTGRFGDWIILEAEDEEAARKLARRRTRRAIGSVRETIPTRVRRERAHAEGRPFPEPWTKRQRR